VYRYRADKSLQAGLWATMYSAESSDAPQGPEDARFWDWVLASLLSVIVVGLLVWGLTALL
jgi:hypothetical protein